MNQPIETLFPEPQPQPQPITKTEQTAADESSDRSAEPSRGLVCPQCGCRQFSVYYTRQTDQGTIHRRRRCRNCSRSVLTTERITSNS